MIDLTRLNGNRLLVNCDLIKFAEASPDTTLALVTGEKLVVRESCDEVVHRTRIWRAGVLRSAWPDAAAGFSGMSAQLAQMAQQQGTENNT